MQIRRHDASREIELRGTAVELSELADMMLLGHGSIELVRAGDPSPYTQNLSRVNVARASGLLAIRYSADFGALKIHGGGSQLGLLAANLQGFADEGDATSHLHIDYFPECDYLDESSEPLVIALTA
jgi:hypothetical protein